ncbi:MAG: aminotransferase class V-fold PLP-dependent enzyme, partial [Blastocatellia bacterium]
ASPDEVAVVASASAAVNSVASGMKLQRRNKVIMGEYEFPTMAHIWLAQESRGAKVQFLDGVENAIPTEKYESAIDDTTLIVPVTQISFVNGNRSNAQAIVRTAHASGALVMLDSYQDCGTRPMNVKALDVDFMVSGTLKYLLGPPGLAFLYVRQELIADIVPSVTGWFAQSNPFAFNPRLLDPAPTARRFEAGTPPIPNIYAAMAGVQLLEEIGLEKVANHVAELAKTLIQGAKAIGIETKTAADSVGPLVVLKCPNAETVVEALAKRDIVVSSRRDGLRVSFHVYNTAEDVKLVLDALAKNLPLFARSAAGSSQSSTRLT